MASMFIDLGYRSLILSICSAYGHHAVLIGSGMHLHYTS